MKSLRDELIDFCEHGGIQSLVPTKANSIDELVDDYLSINSEAPNETPNVNNNEAQEKDCNSCEHRWMPITDCCRCSYLNNYEYWKQSD